MSAKFRVEGPLAGRSIIIEYNPVGSVVKVTAMDERSLTEVSISGPATTPQEILNKNVIRRLEYVMRKNGLID